MIGIGLCLAITTKTYGYALLLIIPLLCLAERRNILTSNFWLKLKPSASTSYIRAVAIFSLLALLLLFILFYVSRDITLIGSPFGYSVKSLVNYSQNELWADNILNSSGIHRGVENFPQLNQNTALLLSYGLFPLFMVPLAIGIFFAIKNERWSLGIFAIYILLYYVMFVTILQLRDDRHLLSIIALLSPVYVYGLKTISEYLGFGLSGKTILCITLVLCVAQLPLSDAIYGEFKVANIFSSLYYWYNTSNLAKVLTYSLLIFAVVMFFGKRLLTIVSKPYREWYAFGILFGILVFAIIGWPVIHILNSYARYEDYIHVSYQIKHFGYPLALQGFITVTNNDHNAKLLYLHGLGTEYLTFAHNSYVKIDDFRMLAKLKNLVEEQDHQRLHDSLISNNIKYILYPSELNVHYSKLVALSKATNNAPIFSDPSSFTTMKIRLNDWWDLYIV
jgi:hypothetical protein